jgi:hypothetical protein
VVKVLAPLTTPDAVMNAGLGILTAAVKTCVAKHAHTTQIAAE